jgi:fumarate hydratase class II
MQKGYRIERDTLGSIKVPKHAYYGAQTQRAYKNFPISNLRFQRIFIRALGIVKYSAAKANIKLGLLDKKVGEAIVKASREVIDGRLDNEFIVDVFQTGSGTSTNMNANEVIANRAIEILGGKKGSKGLVHPNDHVNMGQSSNDVFPTAIRIACVELVDKKLLPSLKLLKNALDEKGKEFESVVKAGRTHLQDALPVTLGQEFSAYAKMIEKAILRIKSARDELKELPLGGTAVGTGLNTHKDFAGYAIKEICMLTGIEFKEAENKFEIMQSMASECNLSSELKVLATSLMKIANDLRLLTSGPRTGLYEVSLPVVQPGSSIMPSKVNPVIAESLNMVCAQVIGNDLTITISAQSGQLELNTMMPVLAYNLIQSIEILANSCNNFAKRCIKGIKANVKRCRELAESSLALITVISPVIGYDKASKIAKRALDEGKSIKEVLIEEGFSKEEIERIVNVKRLARGGLIT